MAEQGKQNVECRDTKAMMNAIENELSKIVGLDAVKLQLAKLLKGILLDQRRRVLGLEVGPRRVPQFAFLGNPGTGKTMVARVLGKLLHMVGVVPTDKVIEVQRTDLVGQYTGQTGQKTREKIKKAEGGILFVDEAYRLVPVRVTNNDHVLEAIEEIMCFMDSGKTVVILAGYTKLMDRIISSNEGICMWVSNIFHFDDFSCEQLAQILHFKLRDKGPYYGFKLEPRCTSVIDVAALIERGTGAEQRRKINGRLVEQMLIKTIENLDSRIDIECMDKYSIAAITLEDLAVGLWLLRAEENKENYHLTVEELLAEKKALERIMQEVKEKMPVDEEKAAQAKEKNVTEVNSIESDKEKAAPARKKNLAEVKPIKSASGLLIEETATQVGLDMTDPQAMANMGYLLGISDTTRSVNENLPETNLEFLARDFEEYMENFPGTQLKMLSLGWELLGCRRLRTRSNVIKSCNANSWENSCVRRFD